MAAEISTFLDVIFRTGSIYTTKLLMTEEKTHFYFVYSRKQQAKNVVWNMLLLPFCLGFCLWLFQGHATQHRITQLLVGVLLLAELLMLWRLCWLLRHPASFVLKLTDTEFSSQHPTFARWCFVAKVADIITIEQRTDVDAMLRLIVVRMQNGNEHLICPNYNFNRQLLYQKLKELNPQLVIPAQPWWFYQKNS